MTYVIYDICVHRHTNNNSHIEKIVVMNTLIIKTFRSSLPYVPSVIAMKLYVSISSI